VVIHRAAFYRCVSVDFSEEIVRRSRHNRALTGTVQPRAVNDLKRTILGMTVRCQYRIFLLPDCQIASAGANRSSFALAHSVRLRLQRGHEDDTARRAILCILYRTG
jgi:hypothetical protein